MEQDEPRTDEQLVEEGIGEMNFLNAMNAYRRAKAMGDPQAIAVAERKLQDYVRSEMVCSEQQQAARGQEHLQ